MNEPTIQPDNDLVICPNCVTQFRAIPVNVQKEYFDMQDRLKSLDAQPVPDTVAVPRECGWKCAGEFDPDTWETNCGHAWTFVDGGPKDNNVNFCMYCGNKVAAQEAK